MRKRVRVFDHMSVFGAGVTQVKLEVIRNGSIFGGGTAITSFQVQNNPAVVVQQNPPDAFTRILFEDPAQTSPSWAAQDIVRLELSAPSGSMWYMGQIPGTVATVHVDDKKGYKHDLEAIVVSYFGGTAARPTEQRLEIIKDLNGWYNIGAENSVHHTDASSGNAG